MNSPYAFYWNKMTTPPCVVTDSVSLKPFGVGLKYFTCTEIYTKAVQACEESDGASLLKMCKISKAFWKILICLSLKILYNIKMFVQQELNYYLMIFVKIISFSSLLPRGKIINTQYFLPFSLPLIKIPCKKRCDHDQIIWPTVIFLMGDQIDSYFHRIFIMRTMVMMVVFS